MGIRTLTSPAVVETVLSRDPLRWVLRSGVRSCGAAPITEVASASIRACSIVASIERTMLPASAALRASVSSSRADWFRVIA